MWTKQCRRCSKYIPIKDYSKCHLSRDGFKSTCRWCYDKTRIEFTQEYVQAKLQRQSPNDKTISICDCGLYYRNTIKRQGLILRKFKCPKCDKTDRNKWKDELDQK